MSDACGDRKGEQAGYQRHRRAGEDACVECRTAAAAAERRRRHERGLNRPMSPAKHGTYAGYIRHIKRGEEACRPCKRAHRDYMRKWRNGNYGNRSNLAECIVDVLTTFDVWMTADRLVDEVLRIHPEWSARSVERVAFRLVDEGVIERRPIRFSAYVEFRADESAWEKVA